MAGVDRAEEAAADWALVSSRASVVLEAAASSVAPAATVVIVAGAVPASDALVSVINVPDFFFPTLFLTITFN